MYAAWRRACKGISWHEPEGENPGNSRYPAAQAWEAFIGGKSSLVAASAAGLMSAVRQAANVGERLVSFNKRSDLEPVSDSGGNDIA